MDTKIVTVGQLHNSVTDIYWLSKYVCHVTKLPQVSVTCAFERFEKLATCNVTATFVTVEKLLNCVKRHRNIATFDTLKSYDCL